MEITFKMDGGMAAFPGLRRPTTVDTEQLPPEEAATVEKLVADACFFDLPASPPAHPKAADLYTYTISVTDGARCHEVKLVDPVDDPHLMALITYLKGYGRAKRR